MPNQGITFSSSGSNNTIAAPSGTTNASGAYAPTLVSTRAEVKTVTATVATFAANATVTFVAGPPAAGLTTLVANPNRITADGSSTTVLTVTVLDAFGNPVPCVLLDNQNITCWGYNGHGGLGLGDATDRADTSSDTPNTYPPIVLY